MIINLCIKRFLAFALPLCLLIFLAPSIVFAKTTGILISPTVVTIHAQENGVIKKIFSIENTGRDSLTIAIVPHPFTAFKNGILHYLAEDSLSENTRNFITQNVLVLKNDIPITSLTLAPRQKQALTLQISIKDIQNISEYTFSLFFLSSPHDIILTQPSEESPINANLGVSLGTAMHVLIAGKEASADSVAITSFQTKKFIQQGPVDFGVELKNDSKRYIKLYGNIIITNMFGQKIGLVRIPNQILLAGVNKTLEGQNQTATTSWNEKYLLGFYKARLELLNEEGKELHKEVSFFAFPVTTVLLTLSSLLIASFLVSQVRKRLR